MKKSGSTEKPSKMFQTEINPANKGDKEKRRGTRAMTSLEENHYLGYKMVTDLFDFERLTKVENFAVKQYKDSVYRGEVVDNKRHGLGVIVYNNGRVYEGSWLFDKRHGKGYEKFSNGNTYLGDYTNGRVDGKGLYSWANGETYDGEWSEGIKHGYGVWKGNNGDSYMGQWHQNKAHGYGVH
jgi:hypothetical protein